MTESFPAATVASADLSSGTAAVMLVRYGAIPEVARAFAEGADALRRGDRVVVSTHRGLQIATVLEQLSPSNNVEAQDAGSFPVVRALTADDKKTAERLAAECEREFDAWCERIRGWKLQLELIDLERTLDGSKLILYVLNSRGPDCTKLALYAAAGNLGIIEVQPVGADGLIQLETGGGCGSGGGGCHRE